MTDLQSLLLYLVAFFISCFFAFFAQQESLNRYLKYESPKNTFVYFILLILSSSIPTIIAGLRYNVGVDYGRYVNGYYQVVNEGIKEHIFDKEIGHMVLIKMSELIFNDPQGLFLFSALLTMFFLYLILNYHRYKIPFFLILILYYSKFYAVSLNVMRQSISMVIIVYSLKYIIEKNFKRYLFFVLLASMFHTTALIALPFYIVFDKGNNIKIYRKILILLAVASIVIFLPQLLSSFSNIQFFKYDAYATLKSANLSFSSYLTTIFLILILIIRRRDLLKYDKRVELYTWLYIYGAIFSLASLHFEYAGRISRYFDILSILLIPYIVIIIKNKPIKYFVYFLVVVYAISTFVMANYIYDSHQIIPYRHVFYK
ncbi:EpsG family protein [Psychrobacillus sp. L4]|uniref:EpsG family protein n=1 Tax=Psychrobacillus sp. L4 TaxID=3236892 RepID=UPI0036F3DC90